MCLTEGFTFNLRQLLSIMNTFQSLTGPSQPFRVLSTFPSTPIRPHLSRKVELEVERFVLSGCQYICHICAVYDGSTFEEFNGHIQREHGRTVSWYARYIGSPMNMVCYVTCLICEMSVLHTSESLKRHFFRFHQMDWIEYVQYTQRANSRGHMIQDFADIDLMMEDKTIDWDVMDLGLFSSAQLCYRCDICHQDVSVGEFDTETLDTHMKAHHRISLAEWEAGHTEISYKMRTNSIRSLG